MTESEWELREKIFKDKVQSCIDHIKTAVDVDPWAKDLAEEMISMCLRTVYELPDKMREFWHCDACDNYDGLKCRACSGDDDISFVEDYLDERIEEIKRHAENRHTGEVQKCEQK